MLPETHPMKKLIAVAILAGCAASSWAQETPADPTNYIPYLSTSGITQEQLDEGRKVGEGVVKNILEAYEKRTPEQENVGRRAKARMDDIADESMAADRDKVLEFLGIDPQSPSGLYFFVSFSMPLEMLRSYAIEAMWAGGTLVFRGVPPGKDVAQFVTQDLKQLVYGKGAAANISIDPRLFDAYGIKSVPAIVFSTVRSDLQCIGDRKVPVAVEGGQAASYDGCPGLDPANYWVMSGAITSSYALQTFIDDGALGAKPYLSALAKGWAGQSAPAKEQREFSGKWEDALSPSEKMTAKETSDAIMSSPLARPQ